METWKKTLEEMDEYKNDKNGRGKIEIVSESEVLAMKVGLVTPRFGVLQSGKVRPIDDYRKLNASVHVQEACRLAAHESVIWIIEQFCKR